MKLTVVVAASALMLGISILSTSTLVPVAFGQSTATAALRTTTFAIENMTCALCPVTVKTAIDGVEGVQSVEIDFTAKTATVVFDPTVATLDAIAAASTNAGYPAEAMS